MSNISPFTNDSSGPYVKGKIFDIVIMSSILPFKNGPEESFVKGEIFYMITMSNTLPFTNGPISFYQMVQFLGHLLGDAGSRPNIMSCTVATSIFRSPAR